MNAPARRPNPEHRATDLQRQEVAKGLHDDIDTIIRAWPQIQHMAYTMGRGYPTQPPDTPHLLTEDELEHGTTPLTPVERLAATTNGPDLADQAVDWFAHLTETLAHIRTLTSEAAKLTWTPQADTQGEPGCIVHAAHGTFEPVHKNLRCRWCYDFWNAESVDPPGDLLAARAQGKRITTQMVRAALNRRGNMKRLGRR